MRPREGGGLALWVCALPLFLLVFLLVLVLLFCGGAAHHLLFCLAFAFEFPVLAMCRSAARLSTHNNATWTRGWCRSERMCDPSRPLMVSLRTAVRSQPAVDGIAQNGCAIPAGRWLCRAATPAAHALLFITTPV